MKLRSMEKQVIGMLREHEAGGMVKEVTRRHGISDAGRRSTGARTSPRRVA